MIAAAMAKIAVVETATITRLQLLPRYLLRKQRAGGPSRGGGVS
jgi:hypothetical protein